MVCAMTGEFLLYIPGSPQGSRIDCIVPYSRGFIATGEDGLIWPFERSQNEDVMFRAQQDPLCSKDRVQISEMVIPAGAITQACLNSTEDILYFIDRNNQLLKIPIALDGTDIEERKTEYVHGPFHYDEITGMDICMRKQLIVTCSKSYICIWNYQERKFEMCYKCPIGEEGHAVAFHPSGFHILAALGDNKISMMNVLSGTIKEYHQFQFKNCREIRFSNGGHLFAAGTNSNTYIFNFYTLENPPNLQCKGHSGKISNIDWFEDDSGFADCCNQGLVYFYDL